MSIMATLHHHRKKVEMINFRPFTLKRVTGQKGCGWVFKGHPNTGTIVLENNNNKGDLCTKRKK